MKGIYIKSINLQNFKATISSAIELPQGGIFCHASKNNINKAENIEAFKSEFKNRFFAFAEPNFVIEF